MKQTAKYFLFILFTPLMAFAEEPAINPVQLPTFHDSYAAGTAPAVRSGDAVELYAVTPGRFRIGDNSVVAVWRERVYKTLPQSSIPYTSESNEDIRLLSNQEREERSREGRVILRTVLNETLKFTQERLPELDRLVKAMRLEVSASLLSKGSTTAEATADIQRSALPVHRPAHEGLFVKTGLRVPVESGRLSLLSETEATFGTLSTFFKIYVDGRYDNSVGVAYVLARDVQLMIEQQSTHAASLGNAEGTTVLSRVSTVHFVCTF